MTGYGPPDDPSEAPTGYIDYGDDGYDFQGGQQQPPPGSPWYRKPIVLLVLGLFVAILIGLAIYVLADRTHGSGGSTQTPTSPTSPMPSTGVTTTTPAPTTTEGPAAPAPTTALTFPPTTTEPTTTPVTTTTTSPPPPPSTTIDDGHHHHHHHGDGGTP